MGVATRSPCALLCLVLAAGPVLAQARKPKPPLSPRAPAAVAPAADGEAKEAAAKEAAAQAKARGDAFMDSGRPAEALVAYTEAAAMWPDPALQYNRARAYEKLGQFPSALEAMERFSAEAPPELKAKVPKLEQLLATLRQRTCTLTLSVNVPGAEVRLGDRIIGTTPLAGPRVVDAGRATVRVTADGYFDVTRELELPGAGRVGLELTLASKKTDALLRVESTEGAVLRLDEAEELRSVPVETPLPPGTHRLRLSLDGHLPLDTTLVLAAGEARTARLLLTREAPFYARWYFWAGVAAVIAAAVTTGIAVTTERPAPEGSLGITPVRGGP
ncbi:MAG: PEGA domain-containing protein [Myxococcaceae bacterium]|nr:PEGA domain-containing protein [Myxococcaceae bacterium]MCA3012085.1 PEGA domain-containing protein [Myxococcaceae bacterium]